MGPRSAPWARSAMACAAAVSLLLAGLTGCGTTTGPGATPSTIAAHDAPVPSPTVTPPSGPQLVGLYPAMWLHLERSASSGRGGSAVEDLRAGAEAAMAAGPWTVTSSPLTAPGGDAHQYISLSRYWWPTEGSKDGLPYVRRDGQTDPLVAKYPDETYLDDTVSAVDTLARAYSILRKPAYAARAATLLTTFFLDPSTAMAPDVTWGQFVPGQSNARSDGILDTRVLINLPDDLTLLRGASAWTGPDQASMTRWLDRFSHWLLTSALGRSAAQAPNNHGTWYDAEEAAILLYLGQRQAALNIVDDYVSNRLGAQVTANGSQPLELARTDSWTYSTFNLEAALELASVAELLGRNIFDYRAASGGSLVGALDYLLPYATRSQRWPYQQIDGFDPSAAAFPAWIAATWFDDRSAGAALAHIPFGEAGAAVGADPLDLASLGSST